MVVTVDVRGRALELEDGGKVGAEEALVLAIGKDPVRLPPLPVGMLPGAGLDGVAYLHDNDEAFNLAARLAAVKSCPEGKNVVRPTNRRRRRVHRLRGSCGGGRDRCAVAMVFPEAYVMPRLFNAEIGAAYGAVRGHGRQHAEGPSGVRDGRVCNFLKTFVEGAQGKVGAVTVWVAGEEADVPADLVVDGVGARPATDLYAGQLERDDAGGRSVVVDAPRVHLCGTCARVRRACTTSATSRPSRCARTAVGRRASRATREAAPR